MGPLLTTTALLLPDSFAWRLISRCKVSCCVSTKQIAEKTTSSASQEQTSAFERAAGRAEACKRSATESQEEDSEIKSCGSAKGEEGDAKREIENADFFEGLLEIHGPLSAKRTAEAQLDHSSSQRGLSAELMAE